MNRNSMSMAALLGGIAVVLGAYGAHGLEGKIDDHLLGAWKTGVLYHFFHVFALLIAGIAFQGEPTDVGKWVRRLWLAGILLFSGSLYMMALGQLLGSDWGFLGPVTPLGGLCFIAGWVVFAVVLRRRPR